ncbi:hypothetical protein [Streptomyces iakyrus]|uniref:hypothetical protein n=1 Tax=Streptomyces iakyrus TaxID=68219 RepID=UPI0033FB5A86
MRNQRQGKGPRRERFPHPEHHPDPLPQPLHDVTLIGSTGDHDPPIDQAPAPDGLALALALA